MGEYTVVANTEGALIQHINQQNKYRDSHIPYSRSKNKKPRIDYPIYP